MLLNLAKRSTISSGKSIKNKLRVLKRQNSDHSSSSTSSFSQVNLPRHGASTADLNEATKNDTQLADDDMAAYSKTNYPMDTTPVSTMNRNAPKDPNARKVGADEEFVTEEVHSDAVYVIKFKKIYNEKYNNSTNEAAESKANPNGTYKPLPNEFRSYVYDDASAAASSSSASKGGLVYTKVKIRQLKYATLAKFVENLTNPETGELDSNLVQTFLATYRTFTDTPSALNSIRARYEKILPATLEMTEDVRQEHVKSFRVIMRIWLENYVEDFLNPEVSMSPSASPSMSSLSSSNVDNINFNLLNDFCTKYMQDSKEIMNLISSIRETNERSRSGAVEALSRASSGSVSNLNVDANNNKIQKSNSEEYKEFETEQKGLTKIISRARLPPSGPSSHRRTNSSCTNLANGNVPSIVVNNSSSTMNLSNAATTSSMNKTKSLLLALASDQSLIDANNNYSKGDQSSSTSLSNLAEKSFMSISSQYFAEQITYLDKCLFQKVCAHHCLAGVWNTRYKNQKSANSTTEPNASLNGSTVNLSPKSTASNINVNGNNSTAINDKFASIRTFIDQFNFISFMVQATILENLSLKPSARAKIIEKWIEIAVICRQYKNFSSLNAIVQGLNIQCISRLEKTWNEVSSDSRRQFEELAALFSEDENQKLLRETLSKELNNYKFMFVDDLTLKYDKSDSASAFTHLKPNERHYNRIYTSPHDKHRMEGTGKYSMMDLNGGINATLSRKMKDLIISNRNEFRETCGTIPFLGTFLKDLEYIHALGPTKNEQGLINVSLKQKEFEIIAKIRLFQQAAQLYNLKSDDQFKSWLYKQTVYSENQNYELSNKIEPKYERVNSYSIMTNPSGHRKNKLSVSLNSNGSIESLNSFRDVGNNKTPSSSISKEANRNHHSRSSSYGSSDIFYINAGNSGANGGANQMITSQQSYNSANLSNGDNLSHGELSISSNPMNNENSIGKSSPLSSSSTYTTNSQKVLAKVTIDFNANDNVSSRTNRSESVIASTTMYKSIYLKDSDRTKDVKQNILSKFHLESDSPDNYQLYQVITGANDSSRNELLIKDNCNVFYASKTSNTWQFVLRRRSQNGGVASTLHVNESSTSLASQFGSAPTVSQLPRNLASSPQNKFSQLPPQSPNHNFTHHSAHARKKNQFGSSPRDNGDNTSGSWHLFKRILS